MQWLLYIVGGIVGLFVVLLGVGYLLPKDHVAARRITIARPAAEVWRAITDVEAYPRWRTGVTKVERVSATQFRETSSHGAIPYDVVEERPAALRITRIADPALPFGGRWIYELTADGAGTRLTITEDGFITNPIFRVLSRTVFSTTSTMEAYLTDLGRTLGGNAGAAVEPARPSSHAR